MKNLFFKVVLCQLFLWMCISTYAMTGAGTKSNPYVIYSSSDFLSINNNPTYYYKLGSDISLGSNQYGNFTFKGNLDGAGHTITINYQKTTDGIQSIGLFNQCEGATISNLTINGTIINYRSSYYDNDYGYTSNPWVTTYYYYHYVRMCMGSICANATNCKFYNVKNIARIYAKSISGADNTSTAYYYGIGSDCNLGGLVGTATSCTFEQCSNEGSTAGNFNIIYAAISQFNLRNKPNHVGGLVGSAINCKFNNCYIACDVTVDYGSSYALTGSSDETEFKCCYYDGQNNIPFYSGGTIKECINKSGNTCELYIERDNNKSVDPALLSIPSWWEENAPSWDFTNVWYLPSELNAMPKFSTIPSLSWDGNTKYRGSITFKSTNPYTTLEISSSQPEKVCIQNNQVTFLEAGPIILNIYQPGIKPYRPLDESVELDISKLQLTIGARNKEIQYGDSPDFKDIIYYEGFVEGDDETTLTSLPTILCGATSKSDVGQYSISLKDAQSNNYNITYKSGVITILPKPLVVKPRDVTRKYGQSNPSFAMDFIGFVNGHTEAMVTEYPTISTQATIYSEVGEYSLNCRGGAVHPNYKFQYDSGTLTIVKSPLTISVVDAKRFVGEPNPEFELKYSGFRNNDNYLSLDALPAIYCEANIASPVGIYPIILEGGEDNNYEYFLKEGFLIVEDNSALVDIFKDNSVNDVKVYTLQGYEITTRPISPGTYIIIKEGRAEKVVITH